MGDEKLRIILTADGSEVTKTLGQLQTQLKAFQKGLESSTAPESIARLNRAIAQTQKQIGALRGFNGLDPKAIVPGTNQAANALQNLGRIAQDAPFGFVGIQNNINPLLESFQRLKAETGSTGGAIKAMVAGLAGGAGLGLAVSVATGLLTVFGDKLFKSGDEAKKAGEKVRTLADIQTEVNKSLAEEQTQVQKNIVILQSHNASREQQVQALKNLQEIAPNYFKDLKLEEGLIGKLNVAYAQYIAQLNQRSQARVVEKQLDEINAKILDNQKANETGLMITKAIEKATGNTAVANLARNKTEQSTNKLLTEREGLLNRLQGLSGNIDIKIDKASKVGKVKVEVDELELEPAKVGILGGRFSKGISGMADVAGKINTSLLNAFLPLQGSLPTPALDGVNAKLLDAADKARKLAVDLTTTLGPAFQDLFSTIISGGQNALAHFGEAIKQIITKLISAAITAAIFAAIISIAFPNAAAGGANFGKNFSNIFAAMGGIPKRASGGVVTSKQLNIVGEAGPEAIIPLNKLPGLIAQMQPVSASNLNIVGQIRGNDIVLVNKRSGGQYGNTLSF